MSLKSIFQPTVWGATSSSQMRNMRYAKKAIHVGSFFVPGLGTYKAAKLGHKFVFGVNLVGDVSLGVWLYRQLSVSHDDALVGKQADDISPYLLTREDQDSFVVGFPYTSIPDVAYA